MRGLWRTIALMGEDANSFNNQLAAIASQVTNTNLTNGVLLSKPPEPALSFALQPQPTPAILQNVDGFLRSRDATLVLCAYELAEVNRITCEAQKKEVPPHQSLKAYWNGLGAVAGRNRDRHGFMEAVGGLAADGWTRSQFAAGLMDLTKLFDLAALPQGDLQNLQGKMVANSPSDLAAKGYTALFWNPRCASVVTMSSDWTHFNA
jgi:hypothetical protein